MKKNIMGFLFFVIITLQAFGAGVSISKNVSPKEYDNGDKLTYEIQINNTRGTSLSGVTFTEDLFSQAEGGNFVFKDPKLLSAISNVGGSEGSVGNYGDPTIGNDFVATDIKFSQANEIITYTFEVTAEDGIEGDIESKTTVDIDGIEDESESNTISRTIYNYSVTKTNDVTKYTPGQEVSYTVKLQNEGANIIKGMEISDILTTIETEVIGGGQGKAFDPTTIKISAATSGNGSESGLSSNPFNGDLDVDSAKLGPNGIINYTITAKVNNDVVGQIDNQAFVSFVETTRDSEEKNTEIINLSSGNPILGVTKSVDKTTDYFPGDKLTYTINVENTGSGIANNYRVEDILSTLVIDLSSDLTKLEDAGNIRGNPFVDGTITLTNIGNNSRSELKDNGGTQIGIDLNDTVSIFPGDTLTYTIVVNLKDNALGEIKNTTKVISPLDVEKVSNEVTTVPRGLSSDTDIEIIKITNQLEYTPGGTVTYEIVVTNKNNFSFADNISITDKIANIITDQLDGSEGQAFESWEINIVNLGSIKPGTNPGAIVDGSQLNADINISADIAPGDKIIYEVIAKVKSTSIGPIFDGSQDDNVIENGNPVVMSTSKLNIGKGVDDTVYSPNEKITYTLVVENDGDGYALGIPVKDILSEIKSGDGEKAYASWEISATLEKAAGGTLPPSGNTGKDSDGNLITFPTTNEDLDLLLDLGPESRVVYKVETIIGSTAAGMIKNTAEVDNTLVADKGIRPTEPRITAGKSVDIESYSDEDPLSLIYTLKVSNASDGGYARDIKVYDNLSAIEVALLNGTNDNFPVFESYEIIEIIGADAEGNTTGLSVGSIAGGILEDTISVTAGSSIAYKIKVEVDRDTTGTIDQIPYGTITNRATITPKDNDGVDITPINISADTIPKLPRLSIVKSTTGLDVDRKIHYEIKIKNNGDGYANNAEITDSLPTGISNWVITALNGTKPGTNPLVDGTLPSGSSENLDIKADIAPGDEAVYKIVATLDEPLDSSLNGIIENTAKVVDTQNNIEAESSAKVDTNKKTDLFITKEVDTLFHVPGEELIYTVKIFNNVVDNDPNDGIDGVEITVEDLLSEIKTQLANNGTPASDIEGSPFESIEVKRDGITVALDGNGDLKDLVTIPWEGEVTYEIVTKIKDTLLAGQKITNIVKIFSGAKELGRASIQTNGGGDYGATIRNVNKDKYIPGEEIKYTIRLKGGENGYYNNKSISELISEIQVDLLDGTSGNPFENNTGPNFDNNSPKFTVEIDYRDVNSSGTSKEEDFPSPTDDTDIMGGPVDIAPGDEVIYTVTGVVRPDAVGIINYRGLETEPYPHNINVAKRVLENLYTPGEDLTFAIEIINNSNGNANNIEIVDEISKIMVEVSDGDSEPAFPSGEWTIVPRFTNISGTPDYNQFADSGETNPNTDILTNFDLPIGTRLTYEIIAKVNPKAIGDIENTVVIQGDRTTGEAGSGKPDLSGKKTIEKYFDRDGTTEITGGYKPGGWIQYLIVADNKNGKGIRNDLKGSDVISEIKTDLLNGDGATEVGAAFSTWEITLAQDLSILDDEGVTIPGKGLWDTNKDEVYTDVDLVEGTPGSKEEQLIMDIAPGGKVVIRIKAKVDERAVGAIENKASTGGVDLLSGDSFMLLPNISLTKEALELDFSTKKVNFEVEDEYYYRIKIKNDGNGTSIGNIKDLLRSIETNVAEDGPDESNPKKNPLESWEITGTKKNTTTTGGIGDINGPYNDGKDNVTNLGNFEPVGSKKENIDIDSGIFIAPGGEVEYLIKVKLKDNIISKFTNKVSYQDQNNTKSAIAEVKPYGENIAIVKELKYVGKTNPSISIGGNYPSSDLTKYIPGDYVIYEITVSNISTSSNPIGFSNNTRIKDLLFDMKGKDAAGSELTVFKDWKVFSDGGIDPRTYIRGYVDESTSLADYSSNLNVLTDIAPEDKIKFQIIAQIRDILIDNIPENRATAGNVSDTAPEISQKDPSITYYKTFGTRGGTESDADREYVTLGKIDYKVVVENTGDGYGKGIIVKDILNNVKDESGGQAFISNVTAIDITNSDKTTTTGSNDSKTYVSGNYNGINSLNATVNIEPGAKIEFYLEGRVSGGAEGDIVNEVEVPEGSLINGRVDKVTATLSTAELQFLKTVKKPNYVPGGSIEFVLEIRNTTELRADNIKITDLISKIMVEVAGGPNIVKKPALQTGWTIEAELFDELPTTAGDLSEVPTTGDIDGISIDLGAKGIGKDYSRAVITIKGNVIEEAVGNIENTYTYTYTDGNIIGSETATSNPSTAAVAIAKMVVTGDGSETKRTSYTPGEELTFLVEITNDDPNNVNGYATKVVIEDIITDILGELAGDLSAGGIAPKLGYIFDSSKDIDVSYKPETELTRLLGADVREGFKGLVDIHPGETFSIWITGTVVDTALGIIANTATVTYEGEIITATTEVDSIPADIGAGKPTKEISINSGAYSLGPVEYINGDTISYRLTLENTGDGWANNLSVYDSIRVITANISGGGTDLAFDPDTIEIKYQVTGSNYDNDYSNYIIIDTEAKDLESIYDLAPKGKIEFEIEGAVKDNILGTIANIGKYGTGGSIPSLDTNEVLATQGDALITINKSIIAGGATYIPGQEIGYTIEVTNTSTNFANGVKIVDDLSLITVDSSTDPIADIDAFISYRVIEKQIIAPSKVTTINSDNGLDTLVDIAPGATVVFEVYGVLIKSAIGDIENTATYEYAPVDNGNPQNSNTVESTPKEPSVVMTKVSDLEDYVVDGEINYTINILNNGEGIANNISFVDDLAAIMSELSGGGNGRAIIEGSVSASIGMLVAGTPSEITTPSPSINITGDKVTSTFDLAPSGVAEVKIKARVEKDVVGNLTNAVTSDYENRVGATPIPEASDTLGPGNANVSIVKNAIVDPAIGGYIPGEDIKFEILVSNTGAGIGNNINVEDMLSQIIVETVDGDKPAFSSWVVTNEPATLPSFIPIYNGSSDLNLRIDIAPDDTLKFTIIATVIDDAFGNIINEAVASYENNQNNDGTPETPKRDDATFIPSRSEVFVKKTVSILSYAPGDEITYVVKVGNTGPGPGNNVNFEDILPRVMTTTGIDDVLDLDNLVISTDLKGGVIELTPINIDRTGDATLRSVLTIPRGGVVEYTITANIVDDAIGNIENTATAPYVDNDGTDKTSGDLLPKSETVITLPKLAELIINKAVDKAEFIAGEEITYTVIVENTGEGIANDVKLLDLIMSIDVQSVNETDISAFISVETTDNKGELLNVSSIGDYDSNTDLNVDLDIAPGDKMIFTLLGTTDKLVIGNITNETTFSFTNNDGSRSTGSAEVLSEVILNEGDIVLTKQAFKDEIEKGEVVEYEILVRNTTEVYFLNVAVEDKIPAGFDYVEDTTEMLLSGVDGIFGTDDDSNVSDEPIIGSTLGFTAVDIGPKESLRIRYLLRASIGTTFGKYTNTAYAMSGGVEASNRDSAVVEVIPDDLFDTGTIIGKVFEDLNGDGYQGDATAKRIKLLGGVSEVSYIPNSTTLEIDGKVENVPDASPPLQHGVTIGRLRGVSRNRKIKDPNKAILRYETTDTGWEPIKVTTKAGTDLLIDEAGRVTKDHKKDKKKGLAKENLKITRNVYKQKSKETYLQEIIIENLGVYEDGIPGVRLITVDGIVVETDEFGRYHVPDEWILRKNGKNFIIKVDEDTLPQGMKVVSENPRVRRITSNGLNKFNFSIQREEDDFEIKDEENLVRVRGDENE